MLQMIQSYIICWRNFAIVKDSLESIINSSSQLDITVINPNDSLPNSGTDKIREYLEDCVGYKKIKRALLFEENVDGWGLQEAIKRNPPESDWFFMSDGDLLISKRCVKLTDYYHKSLSNLVTGFQLSPANYHGFGFDHSAREFGGWMMGINTNFYINQYGLDKPPIDHKIIVAAKDQYDKIRDVELYHCTWDIDNPSSKYYDKEYVEYKKTVVFKAFGNRPANMNYKVIE
jgi:hypothetical protein